MKFPFEIDHRTVVRTPQYALSLPENEKALFAFFAQPEVQEALFLASPNLLREYHKWEAGEIKSGKPLTKLVVALTKYYGRMHARCTPFGLFARIGIAHWHESEQQSPSANWKSRHTRIDMGVLCLLADAVQQLPIVRQHLVYYPNSSLYAIHDMFRYVESTQSKQGKSYQLTSLGRTEVIQFLVDQAREGAEIRTLAAPLVDEEVTLEDAIAFIEALIEYQVFVSELDFSVTGPEYLERLLTKLGEIFDSTADPEVGNWVQSLQRIEGLIAALDTDSANSPAAYQVIEQQFKDLGITLPSSHIVQVDANRSFAHQPIGYPIKATLKNALKVCAKLSSQPPHYRLDQFKQSFMRRYEDQEIPLLMALDVENGVGYGDMLLKDDNPLTRDLFFQQGGNTTEIKWTPQDRWKTQKLIELQKSGAREYRLTDEDINQFEFDTGALPPTFSAMYRLVGDGEILIEHIGNASATNLLGRFCHTNPAVNDLVMDLAAQEAEKNPEVIFAEIAHLPENRTGNILLRPAIREYEIPFLAQSTLPAEQQIAVEDLYVSVYWDQIYLRSRKLDKRIIPRLSTAHNYTYLSQPIYQFLCDLQQQGLKTHMNFNWGPLLDHFEYLPRVRYKNIVLFRAFWKVDLRPFKSMFKSQGQKQMDAFQEFADKLELPKRFVLADMDNELLVDRDNPLMVQCFLQTVKQRREVILKEFLEDQKGALTDESGRTYANQLVSSFVKSAATFDQTLPVHLQAHNKPEAAKAKHPQTSLWSYFRIYGGVKSLDRLLGEVIGAFASSQKESGKVDKWYFIRYRDEEEHLRIRFQATSPMAKSHLMAAFAQYIEPFEASGLIWKVETGTYLPEINRYGQTTMEVSESIFHLESQLLVNLMPNLIAAESPNLRWCLGLMYLDQWFQVCTFSEEEQTTFMDQLKQGYEKEFNVTSFQRKQILGKYKRYLPTIESALSGSGSEWQTLAQRLTEHFEEMNPHIQYVLDLNRSLTLKVDFETWMASHVHMFLNRLIPSFQRKNELVIYTFLHAYYRSRQARKQPSSHSQAV
ncbi:lantibiotic dehydratase [Pontibacter sp. G13]|uniref:lantibiotic dehydratase n=1 Tax=Pontibacter sp. G13 TaxID=3074898 RepID=UPI002889EB0F|nr:lantibiotic dehydratase [Pontibacter sp. G13]WNJ17538.1 lantibiotic dehydratase [Pontibacter sp. G13]